MRIIGLDPGPEKSALCSWDGDSCGYQTYAKNSLIRRLLRDFNFNGMSSVLAIEKPVCRKWSGASISNTAIEAGVFAGMWKGSFCFLTRSMIRAHFKNENGELGNDSRIRQALISRIYPAYTRKKPGKLRLVSGDIWQALAVAVTCYDKLLIPEKGIIIDKWI